VWLKRSIAEALKASEAPRVRGSGKGAGLPEVKRGLSPAAGSIGRPAAGCLRKTDLA
jgi:hypothetical protein